MNNNVEILIEKKSLSLYKSKIGVFILYQVLRNIKLWMDLLFVSCEYNSCWLIVAENFF